MSEGCGMDEAQLSAWLDGELTPQESRACRRHVESCERCRALCERLAASRELLRAMPQPRPSRGLLAAIRADARQELAEPARLLPTWAHVRGVLAGVAAAAAAVLIVVALTRTQPPTTTDVAVAPPVTDTVTRSVADSEPSEEAAATASTVAEGNASDAADVASAPATPVEPPQTASDTAAEPGARPPAVVADSGPPAPEAPAEKVAEKPMLAWAPPGDGATPMSGARPVAAPSEDDAAVAAPQQRNTTASAELATAKPDEPTALETEIAMGVVARMVVDEFVADHLIESKPTLLSVVTDTPTTELGPMLAEEGGGGRFSLCFTQSMQQALPQTESQVP